MIFIVCCVCKILMSCRRGVIDTNGLCTIITVLHIISTLCTGGRGGCRLPFMFALKLYLVNSFHSIYNKITVDNINFIRGIDLIFCFHTIDGEKAILYGDGGVFVHLIFCFFTVDNDVTVFNGDFILAFTGNTRRKYTGERQ